MTKLRLTTKGKIQLNRPNTRLSAFEFTALDVLRTDFDSVAEIDDLVAAVTPLTERTADETRKDIIFMASTRSRYITIDDIPHNLITKAIKRGFI